MVRLDIGKSRQVCPKSNLALIEAPTLDHWVHITPHHKIRNNKTQMKSGTVETAENKKLEKEILKASEADFSQFKTKVFEQKTFRQIQRYLKCICKAPSVPPTVRNGSNTSKNNNEKC